MWWLLVSPCGKAIALLAGQRLCFTLSSQFVPVFFFTFCPSSPHFHKRPPSSREEEDEEEVEEGKGDRRNKIPLLFSLFFSFFRSQGRKGGETKEKSLGGEKGRRRSPLFSARVKIHQLISENYDNIRKIATCKHLLSCPTMVTGIAKSLLASPSSHSNAAGTTSEKCRRRRKRKERRERGGGDPQFQLFRREERRRKRRRRKTKNPRLPNLQTERKLVGFQKFPFLFFSLESIRFF